VLLCTEYTQHGVYGKKNNTHEPRDPIPAQRHACASIYRNRQSVGQLLGWCCGIVTPLIVLAGKKCESTPPPLVHCMSVVLHLNPLKLIRSTPPPPVQWLPLGQTAFSNASRFRMVLFNDHPSVIEHHLSPTMIQHFSGGLRNGMPAPVLNRTCIISLPPHCLVGQSLNWISLVLASMSVLDRVPSCQRASPAHLGRDINKNLHLFFELFELCISYTC
jgi:hypothetical protein